MYYGSIHPCDIANGTGVRVTLFVSGCTHRSKGSFQPQTCATVHTHLCLPSK